MCQRQEVVHKDILNTCSTQTKVKKCAHGANLDIRFAQQSTRHELHASSPRTLTGTQHLALPSSCGDLMAGVDSACWWEAARSSLGSRRHACDQGAKTYKIVGTCTILCFSNDNKQLYRLMAMFCWVVRLPSMLSPLGMGAHQVANCLASTPELQGMHMKLMAATMLEKRPPNCSEPISNQSLYIRHRELHVSSSPWQVPRLAGIQHCVVTQSESESLLDAFLLEGPTSPKRCVLALATPLRSHSSAVQKMLHARNHVRSQLACLQTYLHHSIRDRKQRQTQM